MKNKIIDRIFREAAQKTAMNFWTHEALATYLKEHPDADRKNLKVNPKAMEKEEAKRASEKEAQTQSTMGGVSLKILKHNKQSWDDFIVSPHL